MSGIPATAAAHISQQGYTGFKIAGVKSETDDDGCLLTLYWKTGKVIPADADVLLEIYDGRRKLYRNRLAPGSRFQPPNSWPTNSTVRDLHHIPVKLPNSGNLHFAVTILPMGAGRGNIQ